MDIYACTVVCNPTWDGIPPNMENYFLLGNCLKRSFMHVAIWGGNSPYVDIYGGNGVFTCVTLLVIFTYDTHTCVTHVNMCVMGVLCYLPIVI